MIDSPKNTMWIDKHGTSDPPLIEVVIKLCRCNDCKASRKIRLGAKELANMVNELVLEHAGTFVLRDEKDVNIMAPWVKLVHDPVAVENGAVTETETETDDDDQEEGEEEGGCESDAAFDEDSGRRTPVDKPLQI